VLVFGVQMIVRMNRPVAVAVFVLVLHVLVRVRVPDTTRMVVLVSVLLSACLYFHSICIQ
jgi:hypothetical protein